MSTARRRAALSGFTFLELTVALSILTLLALAVERTLTSASDNERYLTAVRRATERGQQACYEVFRAVSASRKLLQDDGFGNAYLNALDLSRLPPADDSRLPRIDETGELGPDVPGNPMTGNLLLFVEESDPAPAVADGTTGKLRYVDTYRFICVYRTQTDRVLVAGAPAAHDLVLWRSVPFPSYAQLVAIEDPDEQANVVSDLFDRFGYQRAWDAGAPVGSSFYALSTMGVISSSPQPDPTIDEDPDQTLAGRLVAENVQLAPTDVESQPRTPVFTVEEPTVWAPDGLEVKIAGASGSRKIWIHLVVESPASKGRVAVHASTMIASTRDL